jgi:hypothetical protein
MCFIRESKKRRNKKAVVSIGLCIGILILISVPGVSIADDDIIVNLEYPECPWADINLEDKLDLYLSEISRVPVIAAYRNGDSLNRPLRTSDFKELIDYGKSLGGRFLVDIFIDRIDLEKRKTTVIPQFVSRYQTYGVMTGNLRIVDIHKARMLKIKKIDCSLKANDRWTFVDDNTYDSDLNIPADQKIILFQKLEDKVASELYKEIRKLTRGKNRFGG